MDILFDPTFQGLARALGIHERRHDVLASNLANIDTPGFRAQELDFQAALRDASYLTLVSPAFFVSLSLGGIIFG